MTLPALLLGSGASVEKLPILKQKASNKGSTNASLVSGTGSRRSCVGWMVVALVVACAVAAISFIFATLASDKSHVTNEGRLQSPPPPSALSPPPSFLPSPPPSLPIPTPPPLTPPPPLAPIFNGCTASIAVNFDATANTDDGSCIVPGCDNELAVNYDSLATINDLSCIFVRSIGTAAVFGYSKQCLTFVDVNENSEFESGTDRESVTNNVGYYSMLIKSEEVDSVVETRKVAAETQCQDSIVSGNIPPLGPIEFQNTYTRTVTSASMSTPLTTIAVMLSRSGAVASLSEASSVVCNRALVCIPCALGATLQPCIEEIGCLDTCNTRYGTELDVFEFNALYVFLVGEFPDVAWIAWFLTQYAILTTAMCAQSAIESSKDTTDAVYTVLADRVSNNIPFDLFTFNGSDVRSVILDAAALMGASPDVNDVDSATADCANRNTNSYTALTNTWHPTHPNASLEQETTSRSGVVVGRLSRMTPLERITMLLPGWSGGDPVGCSNATASNYRSDVLFDNESTCLF